MYKYLLLIGLLCPVKCDEASSMFVNPFAALDRHISQTLAYHNFWPWSQLFRAAIDLDAENSLEETQLISDQNRFQVRLNVKHFKPDELQIKVKNQHIIVTGKHKEKSEDKKFLANHFVQSFGLPAGSKPEEVTAVLKENGILTISAPKHKLPPPPPERDVPIVLQKTEKKQPSNQEQTTDKTEEVNKEESTKPENHADKEELTTVKEESIQTTTGSPIDRLDLVEATTHSGKIRKKELKTKVAKDNEVVKGGEGNGLDYALIEGEE